MLQSKLWQPEGVAERDAKGGIGTRTHQAIEALLAGLPVITDPETAPLVEQYRRLSGSGNFSRSGVRAMVCSRALWLRRHV